MKISNGVEMLEIQIDSFGNPAMINPTLIWDDDTTILIDTGTPGSLEQIRIAMNEIGIPLNRLKVIILTHQDIDHIGTLPDLIHEKGVEIEVYAHEADKPYIEGTLPLLKLNAESMAWQMEAIPDEVRRSFLEELTNNRPKAKVTQTLVDNQELPYCGGIRVISTPGHTPGHISLYFQESKTLVAGDAVFSVDGVLYGPHPESTPDMQTALHSLEKFLYFDIDTMICYHGGVSRHNVNKQLKELVARRTSS
ncbi:MULTISPECIES: MBL fold metallo-hydrolase [Paenibacillus]|uniref:MBL fold metallo-hydrolase n=1 Tax=Paenibacillus TaxID=44249 RepID=UPI002FE29F20